jgi:hypothetical protein
MVGDRQTLHLSEQPGANVKRHPISNFVAVPDINQVQQVSQDCGTKEHADRQPYREAFGDLRSYKNCEISGQ